MFSAAMHACIASSTYLPCHQTYNGNFWRHAGKSIKQVSNNNETLLSVHEILNGAVARDTRFSASGFFYINRSILGPCFVTKAVMKLTSNSPRYTILYLDWPLQNIVAGRSKSLSKESFQKWALGSIVLL